MKKRRIIVLCWCEDVLLLLLLLELYRFIEPSSSEAPPTPLTSQRGTGHSVTEETTHWGGGGGECEQDAAMER